MVEETKLRLYSEKKKESTEKEEKRIEKKILEIDVNIENKLEKRIKRKKILLDKKKKIRIIKAK